MRRALVVLSFALCAPALAQLAPSTREDVYRPADGGPSDRAAADRDAQGRWLRCEALKGLEKHECEREQERLAREREQLCEELPPAEKTRCLRDGGRAKTTAP